MKTKTLILIMILFVAYSCKKQSNNSLEPIVDVSFGYLARSNAAIYTVKFSNQDSIFTKVIDSTISVGITEKNLNVPKLNTMELSEIKLSIQVNTLNDKEIFVAGKNIWLIGSEMDKNSQNVVTTIGNEIVIPVKFSDKTIKNNDTLELVQKNDFVKIVYESDYSGIKIEKTLKLR